MALEDLVGPDKYLDALVPSNPEPGDPKAEGDDHIRGIKNTLINTFPALTGAVTVGQDALNLVNAQALIPHGGLLAWPGAGVPTGYLECNGAELDRTVYALLFAAIGTTWGEGDGSTTFLLPDFRGRGLEGQLGGGAGLTGATRGAESVTLAAGNIPQLTGSYTRTDYQGQRAEARGDGYLIFNQHTTQPLTVGTSSPSAVAIVPPRASVTWAIRAF